MRVFLLTCGLIFNLTALGCSDDTEPSTGTDKGTSDTITAKDGAVDSVGTKDGTAPDASVPDAGSCKPTVSSSELLSVKVTTPPTLDGVEEKSVWECTPKLEVTVNANMVYTPEGAASSPSYPGLTTTKVTLRSVYTATDVYFIASWADKSYSLKRYAWKKQADGSWKQQLNKDSSGHENTYYEDKFAVQWNISSKSFGSSGCYSSCHAKVSNSQPGKKYNPKGEITDMWHWKSVRTEPNGQLDDKYVGFVDSGKCSGNNCRLADTKTAGGYKDNTYAKFAAACAADPTGKLSLPCFMGPTGYEIVKNSQYWILDSKKQTFKDSFKIGDEVAAMITAPFVGSRADVTTKAKYTNGIWVLEIKRSLKTTAGAAEDVQFSDLSKSYEFGVAVFDNTQINHAAHGGALKLKFKK